MNPKIDFKGFKIVFLSEEERKKILIKKNSLFRQKKNRFFAKRSQENENRVLSGDRFFGESERLYFKIDKKNLLLTRKVGVSSILSI